jgi:meso-butanediol dehydrogenase/(S,S)-butanediol dehydrogenase/diacetyl reductase
MVRIDLAGKSALVTGGGDGIGRACALQLARAGAKVYVNDVRAENAESVAREVEGVALAANVGDPDEVRAMVSKIDRLDILVNNAGFDFSASVAETSLDDWDRVQHVHLRGMLSVLQACIPVFSEGSAVVNVSSVEGLFSEPGQSAYSSAKAGILGLTRAAALDLGPKTRVNAVCPGYIHTRLIDQWLAQQGDPDAIMDRVISRHAVGRIGTPDDVASAILFLCSELASFVTGQYLVVDGGLTARLPS